MASIFHNTFYIKSGKRTIRKHSLPTALLSRPFKMSHDDDPFNITDENMIGPLFEPDIAPEPNYNFADVPPLNCPQAPYQAPPNQAQPNEGNPYANQQQQQQHQHPNQAPLPNPALPHPFPQTWTLPPIPDLIQNPNRPTADRLIPSQTATYTRYEYQRDETTIRSTLTQGALPLPPQPAAFPLPLHQGANRFLSNIPSGANIHPPAPIHPPRVYQVQHRTTDPPTVGEKEFSSCHRTLIAAKARAEALWKELYLQRYPGPAPPDVNPHLTYTDWFEWVQLHEPERVSVWGKQLTFTDNFRIEMWVHEKVVR